MNHYWGRATDLDLAAIDRRYSALVRFLVLQRRCLGRAAGVRRSLTRRPQTGFDEEGLDGPNQQVHTRRGPKPRTVDAIREAFERAGIELTNDDRPSARLRKR